MITRLARSAGFCFGVKRALDIVYKTLACNNNVYTLRDIVHNEDVAKKLQNSGLKKSRRLSDGKNKIIVIPAHGSAFSFIKKAEKLGHKIIDATCPMVKHIHKTALRAESKGYKIIIIGDKRHDEVRGIIGQLKRKALVISDTATIPWGKIKKIKKAAIVVQSTQNIEKVTKITDLLKRRIRNCRFFNTICQPTSIKQQEMKNMPIRNDIMVIIGSKTSANTRRLFEISKSLNAQSYWVQSEKDIKPAWFKGIKTVGITAGASTPEETIKKITACIKKTA